MIETSTPEVVEQDRENHSREIVDLFDPKYMIHWTPMWKLSRILKRGIYSPIFAKRIKEKDYKKRVKATRRDVYFEAYKDFVHGHPNRVVGLIVDTTKSRVSLRTAPREISGVVVVDTLENISYINGNSRGKLGEVVAAILDRPKMKEEDVMKRITKAREFVVSVALNLPIYGISGKVYYPQRMSHEEIVEELRGKNKVQVQ